MFSLFRLSAALAVWKINYCTADYQRCARFQRANAGLSVPVNLMPNGKMLSRPGGEGEKP
jgi:hypothetical protein